MAEPLVLLLRDGARGVRCKPSSKWRKRPLRDLATKALGTTAADATFEWADGACIDSCADVDVVAAAAPPHALVDGAAAERPNATRRRGHRRTPEKGLRAVDAPRTLRTGAVEVWLMTQAPPPTTDRRALAKTLSADE